MAHNQVNYDLSGAVVPAIPDIDEDFAGGQGPPPQLPASPESESEAEEEPQPSPSLPLRHAPHWTHQLTHVGLSTLLWLQFFWTLLCEAGSVAQTVGTSVLRGLQSKTYIFFQGSTHPHRLQDYTLYGPGVPPVAWYYDAEKKIFYSGAIYNTTREYELHHFEWLTGEIRYNNLTLYYVTEYLNQIKWAGQEPPSAALVMAAWALHSGVVLTLLDGITLSTINQDASESNLPLRG
jgi:hypothetical protein